MAKRSAVKAGAGGAGAVVGETAGRAGAQAAKVAAGGARAAKAAAGGAGGAASEIAVKVPGGLSATSPADMLALATPWSEPATPPGVNGHLDLDVPELRVESLLLRAGVPSTVTLRGPADLVFANVTVVVTARPLVRNLAQSRWGTKRAAVTEPISGAQFTLAAPAQIEAVGYKRPIKRTQKIAQSVEVQMKEPAGWKTVISEIPLDVYSGDEAARQPGKPVATDWLTGLVEQPFETDTVLVGPVSSDASVLLRSPSLPSRLAVAVGDDSPVQVFATQMTEGGTLTTRDLTPQLTAAWQAAAAAAGADWAARSESSGASGTGSAGGAGGGVAGSAGGSGGSGGSVAPRVEVKLRLTSMTDGIVSVALEGTWGELSQSPPTDIALSALEPASLTVPYTLAAPGAVATLLLKGDLNGGRRLGLVTGPPAFVVRATERLEAAQAVLLAKQAATAAARDITAVWLLLPRVPASATEAEVRLTGAAGDPPVPADEVLARTLVTLPADSGAYRSTSAGVWFRVAFAKPVALDGARVRQPLFVVAAGRSDGVRLCHCSVGPLPADPRTGRIPVEAGRTGTALVRNLERSGSWELQAFNRRAASWIMDLELLPLPAEHPGLVTVTFPGCEPVNAGFAGTGESVANGRLASVQPGSTVAVNLRPEVAGKLTWQMQMFRAIKA